MNIERIAFTLSLVAIISLHVLPASAITRLESTSKWIITLEAEEENGKFAYDGSTLRNLTKVKVGFFPTAGGGDESKATRYETFWMREGKPLGLERYSKLSIPENDDVALRVTANEAIGYTEQSAIADAILRVLLDLYGNSNIVTRIIVPSGSISGISAALQSHNFTTAKSSNAAKLAVFLQTEDGTSTTLYYTR
ncbi:MAG: hypothetical protein K2X77_31260 [Candidatus Obscuribacterales bacterium]|jgi:hypothetical protein|nr:hypothetical protein [Candidatus Obscuribacterales bacterium]